MNKSLKSFGSNRRVYVQQRVSERATTSCIIPTIKHGGGSVMVSGLLPIVNLGIYTRWKANWIRLAISAYCRTMQYHLKHGLWVKDLYSHKMTLKHTSKLCQRYIKGKEEQCILQLMSWLAQSADLNHIEMVKEELNQKVRPKSDQGRSSVW